MRYFTGTRMNSAPKNLIVLALALMLGLGLWVAAAPVAKAARDMTATEMLQAKLPQNKTLTNASKTEVLDAVCNAVSKWREHSPQIVRTAVTTRHEFAGDIVTIAVRCLRDDKDGPLGCERLLEIYRFAIDGEPAEQAVILESFLVMAPDCRVSFNGGSGKEIVAGKETVLPPGEAGDVGDFTTPPSNINPPTGAIGGGGVPPSQTKCTVCHNLHTIQVPCGRMDRYLINHPADFAGSCQPTPTTNR